MLNWHVSTAAEAIAAAQFARLGCDMSVQYGANQPEYDLMIARGERMLKISVKGSSDGGWGISQSQLSKLRKDNPTDEERLNEIRAKTENVFYPPKDSLYALANALPSPPLPGNLAWQFLEAVAAGTNRAAL